jgi:cytochrome c556
VRHDLSGNTKIITRVIGRFATAGLLLSCAAIALSGPLPARGQDATGLTGAKHADDVVMARQLLMDSVDETMMPIDLAADAKAPNLDDLKAKAFTINTLLSIFPHLFPPQTKPAADGSNPTTATAAVWEDFENFYNITQAAATTALELGQVTDFNQFKDGAKKLRAACDGCHAKYMHVEPPPR